MGSEWRKVKLEEVASEVTVGYVGSMTSEYIESGVPFLRSKNVDPFTVNLDDIKYISPEFNEKLKKSALAPGDVVIVRTGKPGTCAVIPDWLESANCSDLVIVRCGPEINNRFLAYYVNTVASSHVNAHLVGAVQQHFNVGSAKLMELSLPSLEVQEQIVSILSALDNKIALNRQINTTLESMAQALFKSWFVDFDPVIDNALATGNEISEELQARADRRRALLSANTATTAARLPQDIQQLFPDRFVFTEDMGWVPEGWEVKSVVDMIDSISDTYPLKSVEKVIFLNTGDILEGAFLHRNYSPIDGLPGQAKKSIQTGDILYSEIRPQNKRFAYVDFDGAEHVVSTKLMVLRSKGSLDSLFPYFLLKQQNSIDMMQHAAESRSGTFPQITYKQLDQLLVCVPEDSRVIDWFVETTLRPVFEQSRKLDTQSQTLSDVRDSLLPKLLSGQLSIPEAEQALDEVS